MDIARIDVIVEDIIARSKSKTAIICEVNAGPGLRMHLQPSEGEGRPVGEAIINMMFPEGDHGRIPIVSVTGVNGKTTTTRLIAHIQSLTGKTVGMTCTDGIYIGGRRIDTGDCSGPEEVQPPSSCIQRLKRPCSKRLAAASFARGSPSIEPTSRSLPILAKGTTLVSTTSIPSKSSPRSSCRIVDVVPPDGRGGPQCRRPARSGDGRTLQGLGGLVRTRRESPRTCEASCRWRPRIFLRDNAIVFADGATEFPIISLDKVPLTHGGKVKFQVENAMAAAAACWMVGTPAEYIRAGLESFGRKWIARWGDSTCSISAGATVIVDYGHNTSSLQAMLDTLKLLPHQRRTAIYSAAGDRRDEDMVRQGELLGGEFDRVILHEDQYLRGREQGEISTSSAKAAPSRTRQADRIVHADGRPPSIPPSRRPSQAICCWCKPIPSTPRLSTTKSLQTETVVLREVTSKDVLAKTKWLRRC